MRKAASQISLDLLEIFSEVVRHGSMSSAARSLAMAPSSAARKIAALEHELNTRLFDRTTKSVLLTEAGATALTWAEEVLISHGTLIDRLAAYQGEIKGTLRIVMNEYVCTVLLPQFLASFSSRHPLIRFAITMTDAMVAPDDRSYDVAVHTGSVPDSGLRGMRIKDLQRILCAAPSYLQERGTPAKLSDLEQHACLVHLQTPGGYWTFEDNGVFTKQPISQLLIANSYLPLIQFALQGMGLIRVSRGSVKEHLDSGELVQVLPTYQCLNLDGSVPATWILYPDGRMMEKTRKFIEELSGYLKTHALIVQG
ncbi:LysR family transcriptional regulator [Caballeronia sp. 15715]|uniref:LysR family transcriptional regulator n=1 Tax=Caballeronia sp. 15715 TaxID=3391030 RepID=UPI0039E70F91